MDYLLKTGDMVQVTVMPPCIVPQLLAPVPMVGTSPSVTVMGTPVCLEPDAIPPAVRGPMPYTSPPFVQPGVLSITQFVLVPGVHLTVAAQNGQPMIIKGSQFQVVLTVMTPATGPAPASLPDPLAVKPAMGQYITTNMVVKAG